MMKIIISLIFVNLVFHKNIILCSNIFGIFPCPSKSHYALGKTLFQELAKHHHEITFVTPFDSSESSENITEIKLVGINSIFEEYKLTNGLNKVEDSVIEEITKLIYGSAEMSEFILKFPKVQNLLKSDKKFDLLIVDMCMTDSLLGIAHFYKIPVIVFSSSGSLKWTNEMVGNPHNPAYNPNIFLGFTDHMNLRERILNSLVSAYDAITYRFLYLPNQDLIYKRYFSELLKTEPSNLPELIDLIHNVSLVFLNTHSVLQFPRPYVNNMIEIGGMHIKTPKKLPADILHFIEGAKDGVIYFSLGGNIQSKDLPIEKREIFVKVFSSLRNIRILWKWENETLENQPENLVIGKWMPQQEILSHENVRLFISHGGLLSSMEAIYFGKPILGIPFFADQQLNLARSTSQGYCRILDYNNITESSLREAIEDVFYNKRYQQNVEKFSLLFKDNPMKQIDKAIYYIQYILRNNGAKHLRSAAMDLNFWQLMLLDVSLIIFLIILIIILVPFIIIGIILRKNDKLITSTTKKTTITISDIRNNHNKKILNKNKKCH